MTAQPIDTLGSSLGPSLKGELRERTRAAVQVARAHADDVDAEMRFPAEAFAELRKQGLLGLMVPSALGGPGVGLADVIDVCYALGQACSSTALIYAMHQVKVGCVVRHASGNSVIEGILRRLAAEQLLLASSTTEGQAGGNIRASDAAIERVGDGIRLERKATVISYALAADGLVTTARRSRDADSSDQVLLVLLKEHYTLERLQGWNTLGMCGTCSEGFTLRVEASAEHVLPEPYASIHSRTMVPFAHLAWGATWAGIAAAATAKAQAFVRHAMRQSNGQLPPSAPHCTRAVSTLRTLNGLLSAALRRYEAVMDDPVASSSLDFQSMITLTKVQASELAVETVFSAMRACGLSGYRNDGDHSMGRLLRDVLSAPLMINNDRILASLTTTSLMTPLPESISG